MKIDKAEYHRVLFENNLQEGLTQKKKKEDANFKECVKKEVDVLIYKMLDNSMRKYEYKDKMHKEILQELLDDL